MIFKILITWILLVVLAFYLFLLFFYFILLLFLFFWVVQKCVFQNPVHGIRCVFD